MTMTRCWSTSCGSSSKPAEIMGWIHYDHVTRPFVLLSIRLSASSVQSNICALAQDRDRYSVWHNLDLTATWERKIELGLRDWNSISGFFKAWFSLMLALRTAENRSVVVVMGCLLLMQLVHLCINNKVCSRRWMADSPTKASNNANPKHGPASPFYLIQKPPYICIRLAEQSRFKTTFNGCNEMPEWRNW